MALINCPECERQISSKAHMCPHCGFPLSAESNIEIKEIKKKKSIGTSSRKRKLPNGYGSVYKLSGNRSKPWVACKTEGWETNSDTKKSKQKRIPIGYFKDQPSALQALAEYNNNPYDLTKMNITFSDIYTIWSERKYLKLSDSTISSYTAAYNHCKEIHDRPLSTLKTAELQKVVDECPAGSNTKVNIKVVMSAIFEYGLQNDIVIKNYSTFIEIETSDPVIDRIVFTRNEIDMLWERLDNIAARIVLILLYTGMRVNELLQMPHSCCDLQERSFNIQKAKNKFSIRKVPIHKKIYDLVKEFYDKDGKNLIVNDGGFIVTYNNFATRDFIRLMKEIGRPEHHLHDTRHTFITVARNHMDKLLLQKIVGHKPDDITDEVYTHIEFSGLLTAINKIKQI